ncbi:acyl-ACP desaturase [Tsukamurella sp. 8F]|uniref:acyl-ACP desaturase n=1 Tax=unclassified Tsukamurella TaxID=2633480 RepID=UPI0023B9B4B2|nr:MULTISPECIES: acyl-ACP desaturase [unclassified Tsukamurella]MDF0530152.1 acyl-ACP desaturase [Tsukamurella sp. 8J]MDF0586470.1 acyl-ACP desaturase [Tsukamurella sp. 8F]
MSVTPIEDELIIAVDKALPEIRDRYLAEGDPWKPHDLVPWDDGRNYAFLGGDDFVDSDVAIDPVVGHGLVLGLLTKDHLPSLHRLMAQHHPIESDWGRMVGHWTAEENRHAIALRDHVVVSRTFDVEKLELWRLEAVTRGYKQYEKSIDDYGIIDQVAMIVFHEALSADYFAKLADVADKSEGTPRGLVETLRKISADDTLQRSVWSDFFAVVLDVNEEVAKAAILDQARKATAIGAETAEGLDESRRIVHGAGIGTEEGDRAIINGILAKYDLSL